MRYWKKFLVGLLGRWITCFFIVIYPTVFGYAGKAIVDWLLFPCVLIGLATGIYIVLQVSKSRWMYEVSCWASVDPGTLYKTSRWYLEEKEECQRQNPRNL